VLVADYYYVFEVPDAERVSELIFKFLIIWGVPKTS